MINWKERNAETLLWIEYRHRESILKYYERKNLVGKERIFAEADMYRAAQDLLNYVLEKKVNPNAKLQWNKRQMSNKSYVRRPLQFYFTRYALTKQ